MHEEAANRGHKRALARIGQLASRSGNPRFADVFAQPSQPLPVFIVKNAAVFVAALRRALRVSGPRRWPHCADRLNEGIIHAPSPSENTPVNIYSACGNRKGARHASGLRAWISSRVAGPAASPGRSGTLRCARHRNKGWLLAACRGRPTADAVRPGERFSVGESTRSREQADAILCYWFRTNSLFLASPAR
jgi:hypothetical protein